MEITGTKQAFETLINIWGVYKYLGVSRITVATWRRSLPLGKVSLDKMEEMLLKYGAVVKVEKVWEL